ncbi:MAG: L,D-transpeptidase [Methylobacterium mesophilicum]|nr:L,D-transpeptidase [Methylobacterium mesophilicum]
MAGAPTADEVLRNGNNGELRSDTERKKIGVFAAMLGVEEQAPKFLPQTQALDAKLIERDAKSKFRLKAVYLPQIVSFTGYNPGTIVIDTQARFLYLVETDTTARRYGIAVGRQGLQYKGNVTVGDKQEWPRWIPTKEMQDRDPKKYGQYKDGMPGGLNNPLGARAIYLYDGKKDTYLRIHGTTEPQSIGSSASNGCFRMVNEYVQELYNRVKLGTNVVVL